mmetsp:Transcript_5900/g.12046  ORF Transcript_5900/g.12046 Transcript_5900/m.12046 type:complete len:347 (-) Transcript_5900:2044-3084(-)
MWENSWMCTAKEQSRSFLIGSLDSTRTKAKFPLIVPTPRPFASISSAPVIKTTNSPSPTDKFRAAYLNFWKVAGAGFIAPEWGKLDVFEFDSNHPADSASKIISAVAQKYPDWWPQVKAKTLPEEACLIMMGYRKYGSGGQYLGVYSRVKGPIDSTSLHELGHRSGGHSYMLGWDTKKKIYTMPGTLSNDGMCMMSYTTRYMDLYAPPWYHRNGWFRAEPGSYRYIQNGATYKMNMFRQWKADGRVHCLVALSPFTGEYVFYKISMIGWSKPGIETTLWLTGRTKNGKTRIPTADIPDIETNNLLKGSNNDGFILWVAYPAAWLSTGDNDMELRACRDPITGGGED